MFIIVPTISRILGVAGMGVIATFIFGLFTNEGDAGLWDTIKNFFSNLFTS